MKLRFLLTTVFLSVALLFGVAFVSTPKHFALADEEITKIETSPVIPSSYLEYYKLSSPVDVSVGDDYFVIAQSDKLISFSNGSFKVFDLDKTITKISVYKHFCLYLSASNLYYIDLETGISTHAVDVSVANYFSIYGDTLVTNPSGSVYRYSLSVLENSIDFSKRTYTSLEFDAAKITLSGDSIYFFNEGKILPFDFTNGAGTSLIGNLDDVRYTATDGRNIYFTSVNGVNKIDV